MCRRPGARCSSVQIHTTAAGASPSRMLLRPSLAYCRRRRSLAVDGAALHHAAGACLSPACCAAAAAGACLSLACCAAAAAGAGLSLALSGAV
jgi:hypothetical protein